MHDIPEAFARRMVDLHEEEGVAWLAGLPALIDACAQHWSLAVGPPFALSYNYVAPATRADGTAAVLKVGVPNPELLSEIAALRAYDGRGCVRLLDAEPEQGALLLERLVPGEPLLGLVAQDDERATAIAAEVMRVLWRPLPPGHSFPSVAELAAGLGGLRERFDGGTGPLPARLVVRAEALFSELLGSMDAPVLLHGDLHHANILTAERAPWLVIDSKGVAGEPAFDIGTFLNNPMPQILELPRLDRILARRIDQLAEAFGFDRARLRDYALAQAVLSAWWDLDGLGYGWEPWIAYAEVLAEIRV